MMAIVNFIILAVATFFAVAAAAALSWICLRIAFVLIGPARAWRASNGSGLAGGTARLARAFSTTRRARPQSTGRRVTPWLS